MACEIEAVDELSDEESRQKAVYLNTLENNRLQFGNISVENSSHVHFGDVHYQGPVTVINQIPAFPEENTSNVSTEKDSIEKTKNDTSDDDRDSPSLCSRFTKRCLLITGAVITTLLGIIFVLVVMLTEGNTDLTSSLDLDANQTFRIFDRSVWSIRKPTQFIENLKLPVPNVIIIHSATSNCKTFAQCTEMIRGFQNHHIDVKNFEDIGYNFLIGGDGLVYEGRGWDKIGAHTYRWNRNSTGICVIGNFMEELPTEKQIAATQNLIKLGVDLGKISPNYRLLGHKQLIPTESPGKRFFELITTWPHFQSSARSK